MAKLRIPSMMRRHCAGKEAVVIGVGSIRDILNGLIISFPALDGKLLRPAKDTGELILNANLNVFINDEDIRFLSGLDSIVGDNDEVSIITAIAGG